MITDYQERMDDLLTHCASIGVIDRQAVEIALTSYLPTHARSLYPPPWICLESRLSCAWTSWFTFGRIKEEGCGYEDLSYWRTKRPRHSRDYIYALMLHRQMNRLFVDSVSPQWISFRHAVHELQPYTIGLSLGGLVSHLPSTSQIRELKRLADLCIGLSHRDILPREYKLPSRLMEACQTLTKLNPVYEGQWDRLYQNVSMAVSSRAALYGRDLFGRDKPEDADVSAGMRVVRDSVGKTERKILDALRDKEGYTSLQRIKEFSGLRSADIQKAMYRLIGEKAVERRGRMYAISPSIREFFESPY